MKKIYSFLLMAILLLVSGNALAAVPKPIVDVESQLDIHSTSVARPMRAPQVQPSLSAPSRATAAADVAYLNGEYYPSLSAAFEVAQSGDVVYMNANSNEGYLAIPNGVTLDMMGHYIYDPSAWYQVYVENSATIQNGTIYTYSYQTNEATPRNAYGLYVSGSANIENLTIRAANNYFAQFGVYMTADATLNMKDGLIYAYYGVYNQGVCNIYGEAEVYGAWYGIYQVAQATSCHVYGDAEVESNLYGITTKGGSLTLSEDCSVISYSSDSYNVLHTTSTTVTIRDNVIISGENLPSPAWNHISGKGEFVNGRVNTPNGYCIKNNGGTLTVRDGRFVHKLSNSEGTPIKAIANYATAYVYGGTYNNTAIVLTEDYAYNDNGDGTYTVRKIIAQIIGESTKNYFFMQDAIIAAAEYGETITLYADANEDVNVSGKSITFNTNAKTLKGNITASAGSEVLLYGTGKIDGSLIENGGSIKVYTGKFTQDPTAFVQTAEGCTVSGPTAGVYTVIQEVAQVNEDRKYPSFEAAISAANELSDATVKLLANARLGSTALDVNKSMTIDLNGKTLFAISNKDSYLRCRATGTTVTIQNGTLANEVTATTYPGGILSLDNGNVVLDNVTISNNGQAAVTVLKTNSTLTVNNGCSLAGQNYAVSMGAGALINNANLGIVSVGNGTAATITNNTGASMQLTTHLDCTSALTINNTGTFEIVDGVYAGTIDVTGTISISGGVFYDALKASVESYKVALKEWNPIQYKGHAAWDLHTATEVIVATIDGQNYYSLEDAIRAVAADKTEKTIILVSDLAVNIDKASQYVIAKDQYIKLDLNGHKITATNIGREGKHDAILFNVASDGQLTVDDNSVNHDGIITYNNTNSAAWLAYTVNCNGTLVINNGTVENTSSTGTVPYTVELGNAGQLIVNGGLINHTANYAIRYWADRDTRTVLNLNGGEIKGNRAIWIQLPGSNADSHPYVEFNMTGGKLTSINHTEALYVYTFGQSLDHIKVRVSGGVIDGNFYVGGGTDNGGNYNEDVDITGGTFITSKAYHSFRRGVEHRSISGGAYYFGTDATANDFIRFCEYITNGHYAVKMCRDDENGTYSSEQSAANFEGKYNLCEGKDCGDGTFWAIIDGEGIKEPLTPTKNGTWSDDPDGVFEVGNVPDSKTDVIFTNRIVTVKSGVEAEANRVVLEGGSGIIVKTGATLEIGTGGIEVKKESTGVNYIIVEAGGTLIAKGTVVSDSVKNFLVEANAEDGVGTVLLDPDVDYNNQPLATVEMYTYARYISEQNKYIWQHFGIPTLNAPLSITNDRAALSQFWQWNYDNADWEQVKYSQKQVNTPFRGYNLKTNYEGLDGVTYTFTGQILGNGDAEFDLKPGFNFYANSYLAPIDIEKMIGDIQNDDVEWTVWMYDGQLDNFVISNEQTRLFGEYVEIPAMRGFFLKLTTGAGSTTGINYENAVWGNSISSNAPARSNAVNDMNTLVISINSENNKGDKLYLVESNRFDANFDNGFDASKMMSDEAVNIYAETMSGNLASVATDDLDGLYLSVKTSEFAQYTISFSHLNGEAYTLYDVETGASVLMTEEASYTFTAQPNTTLANRFQVHKARKVATGMEENNAENHPHGVYTVLGQYVGNVNEFATLPNGVYIINGQKIVK